MRTRNRPRGVGWGVDAGLRNYRPPSARTATSAAIGFATAADVENILFSGAGQIHLWSSYFVIGPQTTLDTQSAFHIYRIEVTAAGAVSVFYDSTLTMSGVVYFDITFEDSTYLWWGDGTSWAPGTCRPRVPGPSCHARRYLRTIAVIGSDAQSLQRDRTRLAASALFDLLRIRLAPLRRRTPRRPGRRP